MPEAKIGIELFTTLWGQLGLLGVCIGLVGLIVWFLHGRMKDAEAEAKELRKENNELYRTLGDLSRKQSETLDKAMQEINASRIKGELQHDSNTRKLESIEREVMRLAAEAGKA